MPIKVFISYVDSYVGKQLLQEFEQQPGIFQVYGCTWDAAAAGVLSAVVEGPSRRRSIAGGASEKQGSLINVENPGSEYRPGRLLDSDSDHSSALHENTSAINSPGSARAPTAPVSGASSVVHEDLALGQSQLAKSGAGVAEGVSMRSIFFSRHDTAEVRAALGAADWIVVEMKQSQEILDIVQYLQRMNFERPKRLVLLSNYMTWYATPPLALRREDDVPEDEEEDAEEVEEEDVEAPYPLPSNQELKQMLDEIEVFDTADESTADAEDREGDSNDPEKGPELLTEDQYNRRVPHIEYMDWRDAEKAVAAAHHAGGLPLDTFVVFAGLPYGAGEFSLEPFFRQSWSAEPEQAGERPCLPVYGSGSQRVPMIHVRDLAVFIRRLLRCALEELPHPERRYLFATDGASLSWRDIMSDVNKMFGGRCSLRQIPKEEEVLHTNVDFFSINLNVEIDTMRTLMERGDDALDGATGANWIVDGGLQNNLKLVADEFTKARSVTPLRVAVVGPPLVGKTYMAAKLAAHYRLPCLSMKSVIAEYESAIVERQEQIEQYKVSLAEKERARRMSIKRQRILAKQQRAWDAAAKGANQDKEGDEEDEDQEAAEDMVGNGEEPSESRGSSVLAERHNNMNMQRGSAVMEEEEALENFVLTEPEEQEMESYVAQLIEESSIVRGWRRQIAEMQRVMLLRIHVRPPTPDANPKRRAANPASRKKPLGKEQQKAKEEEELQLAKEAVKDAPFQPTALALMLRWRLAKPDCVTQGYILDGVPSSVAMARLGFGQEVINPPETEEEALRTTYPPGAGANGEKEEGDGTGSTSGAVALELANEDRLPDHVVVLQASEDFLLDRLQAMGQATEEEDIAKGVPASPPVQLDAFHEDLHRYQKEYVDSPFSVLSYMECATTARGGAGRRAEVHLVSVEGSEPLVPPPPPVSIYEEIPTGVTELLLQQAVLGPPHNFGKNPTEVQRDAVRRRCLEEEQRCAVEEQEAANRAAEKAECDEEAAARSAAEETQQAMVSADLAELERRKEPLARFLQKRVLPLLNKGLIELCATRPENPVDFLAEWLVCRNPHDDVFCDL